MNMELVEHTRTEHIGPGKYSNFDKYYVPLTRSGDTGLYWKYSKNYIKEKQIQEVIWGKIKDVKKHTELENPILIISEKQV